MQIVHSELTVLHLYNCYKRCHLKYVGQTADNQQIELESILNITQQSDKPIPDHFDSHDQRGVDDLCVMDIKSCYSNTAAKLKVEGHFIPPTGLY